MWCNMENLTDSKLKLQDAELVLESAVMEFREAFLSAGERSINGSRGLHNYNQYSDWAWLVKECKKPDNTLLGVQASTYFALRKLDGKVVGCIELRHTLNPALKTIGGHIGYSVVPGERNQGYATEMLQLVLQQAKKAGLDRVLLTCDVDNIASNRIILKCGGVPEQEAPFDYEGEAYYKYWICLGT